MRKINLFCIQGEDFSHEITLLDLDGEPYDASQIANTTSEIRKSYISANAVSFNANLSNSVLSLSLTRTQTANMVPGRYIYDVEFISLANTVTKPVGGIFTLAPGATR